MANTGFSFEDAIGTPTQGGFSFEDAAAPSSQDYATDPIRSGYQGVMNDVAKPINETVNSGMGALSSVEAPASQKLADIADDTTAGQWVGGKLFDAKNVVSDAASPVISNVKDLESYNPDLEKDLSAFGQNVQLAGNLTAAKAPLESAKSAIPSLASKFETASGKLPGFLGDTSSGAGPFSNMAKAAANKLVPSVDSRTAQLVSDASGLGINIPSNVFAPGMISNGLNKAGLIAGNTMKDDVTTALSKVMGHEGTPNLDIDTMGGIQKNIGNRMNNFALNADERGGIPISEDDLNGITKDSNLSDNDPRLTKLIGKIQDRLDNGVLSGRDYQELTQKGGALDRAMKSTDSDFSDTASELREHLDNQLEKTVDPDDLTDFKDARRQYRTMKIVNPLVESGGVAGQVDSASKLYNAVVKNYGSVQNALKYNPDLGKIAQIVNEFPDAVAESPKATGVSKLAAAATAPAALGIGAVGGVPAGVAAASVLPAAYGVGKYLSSPAYKSAILEKSLPAVVEDASVLPQKTLALPAPERPIIGGRSTQPRYATDDEWQNIIDSDNKAKEMGLPLDVRKAQQTALISQYERDNPANNFFNKVGNAPIRSSQTALDPATTGVNSDIFNPKFKHGGSVQPTEAQKHAGNYKKQHISFQGLPISIENPKGSIRSGKDKNGKEWRVKMNTPYGYLKKTEGADGDHVDCFVGPNSKSLRVYIIDQKNDDGKFDEHKVILGMPTREAAIKAYRESFSDKKNRIMHVRKVLMPEFKQWLDSGNTKKPIKGIA